MKRLLLASAACALVGSAAAAQETVNVGIILGFTGPLESITPHMAAGAEMAFKEISDSGQFLGGSTIATVRGDSTCIDAAAATAVAERQITSDNVVAIMGADCSGVTIAIANNVAIPNGVPMVSPSATSPALSTIEDNDFFFRTAPSDARQGEVLTQVLMDRGINEVAVTYTNNDYGKGFSDSFVENFTAAGGQVLINEPHEDGKGDYSAEVAALSASGAEHLVVLGYVDQGGRGIIQGALDTGAFENFILGDGMYGESLIEAIGSELDGKVIGTVPGSDSPGAATFRENGAAANFDPTSSYTGESYDAAALIALSMQAGGSADRTAIRDNLMKVANAPGEPINVGELGKALEIIGVGGDVDYIGATGVELVGPGEAAGSYREYEIQNGAFETIGFR